MSRMLSRAVLRRAHPLLKGPAWILLVPPVVVKVSRVRVHRGYFTVYAVSPARRSSLRQANTPRLLTLQDPPVRARRRLSRYYDMALGKCDSRFFCLQLQRSEWSVPVSLCPRAGESHLVTQLRARLKSELESAFSSNIHIRAGGSRL